MDEAKKHKHHKGDKVHIQHSGPKTTKGTAGVVRSTHYGAYYGVSTGTGMVYMPQKHCTPPPAPTPPSGGGDAPTAADSGPLHRERDFLDEIVELLR